MRISPWTIIRNGMIAAVAIVISFSGTAMAVVGAPLRKNWAYEEFHDVTQPRTPQEIRRVYSWYVDPSDGINKREALIVAQMEAVRQGKDNDYDVAKPKVIAEDDKEWKVRLPGKYSFTLKKPAPDLVICVEKKAGRISCFQ